MAKQRTHTFSVTIRTDKPCTEALALREIKDCIHGNFYTTQMEEHEPGEFVIKNFKRVAKKKAA